MPLSPEEIQHWRDKFRKLSNSARYDEAHALAKRLMRQYPGELYFAYMEAVMTAEEDVGYTPAEVSRRYRSAAGKLRALLRRSRAMTPDFLRGVRNEYYWFSRQPRKQFRLGVEEVRKGSWRGYYSQGVGAERLAREYALAGQEALALRWAKRAEKAWLGYFKRMPKWYNSYIFYAGALGYQGRLREMDAAFAKAARIAGKPKGWEALKHYRAEIMTARAALEG